MLPRQTSKQILDAVLHMPIPHASAAEKRHWSAGPCVENARLILLGRGGLGGGVDLQLLQAKLALDVGGVLAQQGRLVEGESHVQYLRARCRPLADSDNTCEDTFR